jgi:hypothetical protein
MSPPTNIAKSTTLRFLSGLLLILILFSLLGGCGGSASLVRDIPSTIISSIQGQVGVLQLSAGNWIKAHIGMALGKEDTLKTEAAASATVTFFDGSSIDIQESTEIKILDIGMSQPSGTTTTILHQEIGQTISRVKKLVDADSRYEIETPAGVAAVRGTIMFVGVAQDGTTVVGNIQNAVSAIAQGVEVKIPEGSRVTIVPGQAPGQPQPGATPASAAAPNSGNSATSSSATPGRSIPATTPLSNGGPGPTTAPTSSTGGPGSTGPGSSAGPGSTTVPGSTINPSTTTGPAPAVSSTPPASSSAPGPSPTPTPAPSLTPTGKMTLSANPDKQSVYLGDSIVYTYTVINPGNGPLSKVSVTDSKVGPASLKSGDVNSNNLLDSGENWVFSATYVTKPGDAGQLVNAVSGSATGSDNATVNASGSTSVNVLNLIVKITSLQNNGTVTRRIDVTGTVNDPSIVQATLVFNGSASTLSVAKGTFAVTLNLADGTNSIAVTVVKAPGIAASDAVNLIPVP